MTSLIFLGLPYVSAQFGFGTFFGGNPNPFAGGGNSFGASPVSQGSFSATRCDGECAQILGLTNKYREQEGLPLLCLNQKLMRAAMVQSEWQSLTNKMSHDGGPGNEDIGLRVKNQRYVFSSAAENVAMGYSQGAAVTKGWWNSPGHKVNLLSDTVHMGLAYTEKGKFWTQVFGRPLREGTEKCDVTTAGGQNGRVRTTATPALLGAVPACGRECQVAIDKVNQNRMWLGQSAGCINDRLQRAVDAYVKSPRASPQNVDADVLEAKMNEFGYGWKSFEMANVYIYGGSGISKELLEKQFDGKTFTGKDHWGFGGSADGSFWLLLAAEPVDPSYTCWDGANAPVSTLASLLSVPEPADKCDSVCEKLVSLVNQNRNVAGLKPLCWNSRVMAAAKEVAPGMAGQRRVQMGTIQAALTNKGYDASDVQARSFAMTFFGAVSDSKIERDMLAQVGKTTLDGEYSHIGVARYKTTNREDWVVILSTSWNAEETCGDQKNSNGGGGFDFGGFNYNEPELYAVGKPDYATPSSNSFPWLGELENNWNSWTFPTSAPAPSYQPSKQQWYEAPQNSWSPPWGQGFFG